MSCCVGNCIHVDHIIHYAKNQHTPYVAGIVDGPYVESATASFKDLVMVA